MSLVNAPALSMGSLSIPLDGLLLGAGVILGGYLLSRLVRAGLGRLLRARGRAPSFAAVFSTIGGWVFLGLAISVGLTVAFPSVRFSTFVGGLGIVSVAVGIAAQQVLGNLFAGILMVYREPFRIGDQVAVGEVRGTVIDVNLRETVIRTFDGKRVLIPNGVVHNDVITVQTGYERIRSTIILQLPSGTDFDRARTVALEAVRGVPAVHTDPPPGARVSGISSSTVTLAVKFWSGSTQLETNEALDAVIPAILTAYQGAGIKLNEETWQVELGPASVQALKDLTDPPPPHRT
ncbi:mechanosensitive ion channel family protein [Arthrobacter nitrophenolicus]|uniref:Mechanosensitive ion channel n=1 Tax=Arthrobacter nitrophenolicus TaxID=683150 RepID=A0A4V3B202_9MICC|nr:mechanosensitive ion channel domain-containing protein [Arthrobacter nitrophenolicus]TDL38878.1 mechanosensitive ion channel [Arthrobacter nitrophenolicus]